MIVSEPVIRMENIIKRYYIGKPNEMQILNGSQSTKRLRGLLHQYAWIPFFHWLFLRPEVNLLH